MRKALIFSDSHRNPRNMMEVLARYKEVDMILHLGDIEGSEKLLRERAECPVHIVKGNCDYSPKLPQSLTVDFFGKKIAMCHGHRHQVNYGTDTLKYWAEEQEADVVLFGHTHVPYLEQGEKLVVLNPGSISQPRQDEKIPTFAVMELDNGGHMHFTLCNFRQGGVS